MPCGYRKNPELGFVPLALAAAPMAGKLVGGVGKALGGLFGKKKKKKGPAPAASPATAGSPKVGKSSNAKGKARASTVIATSDKKGLTKADLSKALNDYHAQRQASKQSKAELANKLKGTMAPQIAAISKLASEAALRSQVTSEHNKRVKDAANWENTQRGQTAILAKIDQLEKSLNAKNARNKRIFEIFGVHA
jgi:hypothetical protein